MIDMGVAGQHNDRDEGVGSLGIGPQHLDDIEARHAFHHPVQDDDIRIGLAQQRPGALDVRRRTIQLAYNLEHDITPRSIIKSLEEVRLSTRVADARTERPHGKEKSKPAPDLHDPAERAKAMRALEQQMREAAADLEFEVAAILRDELNELRALEAPDVRRGAAPMRRPARPRVGRR